MKTKSIYIILMHFGISMGAKAQLAGNKFRLNIEQNGTFFLEFEETNYKLINSMGEVAVFGTYKIEKEIISFIDTEGQMACKKEDVGKYKFSFENKELKMELIEDNCTGRPNMASKTWEQVEE